MRQVFLICVMLISCGLLAAGCGGGSPVSMTDDPGDGLGSVLPSLDKLSPPVDMLRREVSDNVYELLDNPPLFTSPAESAIHADGELTLDPALNEGLAWAVYALAGLALDGSEYPTAITISKDMAPLWVGKSNFGTARWDFTRTLFPGTIPVPTGADLVSEGTSYVALVAVDSLLSVDSVQVSTYVHVPGGDFQELLIVYNSDVPEDLSLANYYGAEDTGRGIDPEYRIGLSLGAVVGQSISRADYGEMIRDPIIAFLDGNLAIKGNIRYILLMKGIPHQILGFEDMDASDGITSTCSAVDSELCTLYSGGVTAEGDDYPIVSYLWNGVNYMQIPSDPHTLFLSDDEFTPHYFQVSDEHGYNYDLDYLVGRLSAYTYDEARTIVDRSLAADTSGTGWAILDSSDAIIGTLPMNYYDTMVDPVYPYTSYEHDSGYERLIDAGFNAFADVTTAHVLASLPALPPGAANNVIAYCSWGQHADMPADYILNDLEFTYRPGACFMSYESFNASDFDDSDGIQRRAQGQVADFLRMGGTVGIGNAWEPFDRGIGDERWVFDRYIHEGDRWIEAAYKGMRTLSWQEVVVGDPLCRVVAP